MGPWILTFIFAFFGVGFLSLEIPSLSRGVFFFGDRRKSLQKVISLFRELEETLMAGLVPSASRWENLKHLDEPWRDLAAESLKELRECGGALLPTLRRLRNLAEAHRVALEDSRARASQAFAQAGACGMLVPLLGGTLYVLLPGMEHHLWFWGCACVMALGLTGIGSIWLLRLADAARWGGLSSNKRSWVLSSQCAGERFLALVRVGTPPDLAWVKACNLLARDSPELSIAWGSSVWEDSQVSLKNPAEKLVAGVGTSIKKSIQVSLMEGRPCLERVEAALLGLRQDMKAQVERELSILPTQALKPLFVCVAPALLGLLAFGLWLAATESMEI